MATPAAAAFYLPLDTASGPDPGPGSPSDRFATTRFAATALTRGPWSPDAQHAGPPAALLGRAVEQHAARTRPGARVVRTTFEVLRPVPIAEVTVSVRDAESGRNVGRVEAELRGPDQRVAMRATALLMRAEDAAAPEVDLPRAVPGPEECPEGSFPVRWDEGYHTAVEVRFASGSFTERGPAACWFRIRYPLVDGEETSGLCRTLIAADSGNGISGELEMSQYRYTNADLTLHLRRAPVGDWVGLQSRTTLDQAGIGLADSLVMDEKSMIGRAAQTLFVTPAADDRR
ncbi:thioesterase family protein [Streptacidiphilus cavernicola]|uniref:Thioesterase family protein n=1 Tax=Streptacidiphilus cavernicola TaxID=3342716 RepID=A0ABV6VQZ3_9ACTN